MKADLLPDEPSDLEPHPAEPTDPSSTLNSTPATSKPATSTTKTCPARTTATMAAVTMRWEAFIPDDDEWDPEPDPGDFWVENGGEGKTRRHGDSETRRESWSSTDSLSPHLQVSLSNREVATMLALTIVEEIDRLLSEGKLSQRRIAERLGVGRATVSAIASGRRALFGRQPEPDEPDDESQPPERCPKCGYLVQLPCLVCRTREYRHGRQILAELRRSSRGRVAARVVHRYGVVRERFTPAWPKSWSTMPVTPIIPRE